MSQIRSPVAIFLVGIAIFLSFPQWSGAQWVQAGSPKGGWITDLAVSGTNLFAATRKGGVFLSTNNGATWRAVNSGLPKKTDFQCLAVSGTNLFAGTVGRGVFLSTNNGASWKAVNSGLPAKRSVFRLKVIGTNLFAVAGAKQASVFLSTDNGASWTAANSGLPDHEVLCLAVSGTNLFAGTGNVFTGEYGGVFLSRNNGTSWIPVSSGLPKNNAILRLEVIGTSLFAGTWSGGRVFLSTNNGTSWIPVNLGLPDSLVFSLSDLAVSGTNLFLGSFEGVYLSTNNGASWTAINSGLPAKTSVYCLAVSETNLFAGTEEGKVWRLPLSDISLMINLSERVFYEQVWAAIRKEFREAVFIPKEIKAVMQEGLAARQGRQDIPFTIFRYLLFPAKERLQALLLFDPSRNVLVTLPAKAPAMDSLHAVIFFRAKNADLGYAVKAPASAPKKRQQVQLPTASVHQANLNVFIEFRPTDETGASKIVREVYWPAAFQEDSATYDPDKENWYSVGYTLRPGKYTVVIAITPRTVPSTKKSAMNDLKKVGVGYFDIDLPGPESYQTALETTPAFFVKKVEQMKKPDMVTKVHKGMFTWSRIQFVPNIDNVVSPDKWLRIAYYVLGAKPKRWYGTHATYDIESVYEVQEEDGRVAIRGIRGRGPHYNLAGIDQLLPLKQTAMIKDDKGERQEQRDLAPGKYYLVIKVKDEVSGATVEKKVPFEVK